ncbi:MAG TPA: PAS domain-containing protein [Casimicrobiaceae bacterium]|nr:PAS domain-containing protein [Casimicrobiaceae bacterium]
MAPRPGSLGGLSQRMLDCVELPIACFDRDRRYRFANAAFLQWLGLETRDFVGRTIAEVDGLDVHPLYRAYADAACAGERTGFERHLVVPGQPSRWVRVDYHPECNADGEVRGVVVTVIDVDNLKRLELEAGQREHQLRLVTDSIGAPIIYCDLLQKLRFANRPFGELVGVPAEDLLGHALRDAVGPDAYADLLPHAERAFAGHPESYERRAQRLDGSPRWVRVSMLPDREPSGSVAGIFVVFTDIDDDVRIREALQAQQRQLRLFADNIPGPIAYLDRDLRYTFVNQSFATHAGRAQESIYGRLPAEVLPVDVAAFLAPILARALNGEAVEYERVNSGGGLPVRWMQGRVVPDLDGAGKVRGAYCTEHDIHELKLAQQAVSRREEQLRLFTDNIPEPVVYVDRTGRYSFANEAFLTLTGFERDQVIGHLPSEVIGPHVDLALRPTVERALEGEPVTYERVFRDAQGRDRCLRGRMVPDRRSDGSIGGLYVVAHDITDLKEAQEALAARESQLRAIMDGVPAPVAYIDGDERCRYVNRAFLQYFGRTADEASAMPLRDIIGEGIYQSAASMVNRALRGEPTAFDRLVPGAGNIRRWMTVRVVPDAAATGEVNGAFVLMHDIHGLKQAQEALRASEDELRLIMDNVPARVSYIDRDYRLRFLNRHNEEWLGASRRELAGRPVSAVLGEERARQIQPYLDQVLAGRVVSTEALLVQPDGEQRWESIHYAPNRDGDGKVVGIYAVHTDIHDQKRNEEALRRANWMLSSHINNTPLAVLEWDRHSRLVRWSPQAEHIFGWRSDEVLGMAIDANQLLHESDRDAVAQVLDRLMSGEEPRATGITRNVRKDGGTIWCEWYHSCLHDDRGRIVSILSFVQDVSARIRAEERLQYLATRDALTGLPNRLLLHERLAQAIAKARRTGLRVGVLFIDLDRFKNVNDTLGHRVGDLLLKQVTATLSATLRETDFLARLGGDEFMVIVEEVAEADVLGLIAQKLQDAIAQPFTVEDHAIYVTSSIGISVYPDDSDDPDELLKHADVAMYRSKELGRNTFQFLDADLAARRLRQHALEVALRAAVKADALALHYQPIIRLSDRRVIGAEALLRWQDPALGAVPPRIFIPIAEESGLIHALGEWVVRRAARQCVAWRRDGLALVVSVNLSARQFYREDLARRVAGIVREEGCAPQWLELEVTETSLLHDLDAIRKVLHELRAEGFAVAIDDFGTGFSSLTHLKHFPIDTLKIDISFIADLESDPGDAAITEAIIGLARGLGLTVVAEGVETAGQLAFLVARGCHLFQGYWASPPLAVPEFERYCAQAATPVP